MEEIRCIFCSKISDHVVIEEAGYKGRKCPTCGLIYISPRPSLSEIQDLYRLDQRTGGMIYKSGTILKRLTAQHHLGIIKKFIKNGFMLEIGPGAGDFLDESRKEGFDVYGIELNKVQADFIREKLGIPCGEHPLDVHLFDGKRFDIVYHCNVLSHFYDPISEFKKINNKLRKGGLVVFETGNFGDVEEKYFRRFYSFGYPYHLFFFSVNNLKELLLRTGFELISIYRFSALPHLMLLRIANYLAPSQFASMQKGKNEDSHPLVDAKPSFLTKILKHVFLCFIYLSTYKLGYLLPKKGRPQAVIVVAKKIDIRPD